MIFKDMRKLFVFGDSFSEGWDSQSKYSKWKGYTPKVYGEILSDELGIELVNYARGGWSNYDIFESICKHSDEIQSDDIVIVGWSGLLRFRMVNTLENKWISFQPGNWDERSGISKSTFSEILSNRTHYDFYKGEILNWIHLLQCTFRNNTFVNWTWSRWDWGIMDDDYETIKGETNHTIWDWHWSEREHYKFSESIMKKIEVGGFINELV